MWDYVRKVKGLTPYEYVYKVWTNEPERFNVNSFLHTMGLNNSLFFDFVSKLDSVFHAPVFWAIGHDSEI